MIKNITRSPLQNRCLVFLGTLFLLLPLFIPPPFISSQAEASSNISAKEQKQLVKFRKWIKEMKVSRRGPFERILWFCNDGSILLPKAYACRNHGGGVQHGKWSKKTLAIRKAGYQISNLLISLDPEHYVGPNQDIEGLKQILLERFLISADDGWILRQALSYRGAFQIEDEERAAKELISLLLEDPNWLSPSRFFLLREIIRLLPQQMESSSVSKVRLLSKQLHEKEDPGFAGLRAKIHGAPSYADAASVRSYAKNVEKKDLKKKYLILATLIDKLYSPKNADQLLIRLVISIKWMPLKSYIYKEGTRLRNARTETERIDIINNLLKVIRDGLPKQKSVESRLLALQFSLALERAAFVAGTKIEPKITTFSKRQKLDLLYQEAKGLYGQGLISKRQMKAIQTSVAGLINNSNRQLKYYRREVQYLSRATGWAGRTLAFVFGQAEEHLAKLEPLVHFYPQDRLRSSSMYFYSAVVDDLILEANRLANMEHNFFGNKIGGGLRALNPGITRGVLRVPDANGKIKDQDGIYLLPETIAELPPVKGILTMGEGSSLSHVQLLARNLGIPNVVVANDKVVEIKKQIGKKVVLAVSPEGVINLEADSPRWDRYFSANNKKMGVTDFRIKPDLEKLNLKVRDMIPLSKLRASDSGRISGPKSANLGELRNSFGDMVPDGIVTSFGLFRRFLNQPIKKGGPILFTWMKYSYAQISSLPEGSPRREKKTRIFLKKLRKRITKSYLGKRFRKKLKLALRERFGKDGSYGVFVRSDTNVEDLPGFTGAGLNRTVANVVGFENIVQAIKDVWASPFTQRAYAWRQSHMDQPEYVFPAVLIQYSFPSEKSGVMVTKDLEWGEPGWITIAVNEGVGGAVDGQAAEMLRVNLYSGKVIFLSQASAPTQRILSLKSGLTKIPATGSDRVLTETEIQQLVQLAKDIPKKFPHLIDEHGKPSPADVEFAFKDDKLALLQIRPLVEAKIHRRIGVAFLEDKQNSAVLSKIVSIDDSPVAKNSK
jgi:hypothetical protein